MSSNNGKFNSSTYMNKHRARSETASDQGMHRLPHNQEFLDTSTGSKIDFLFKIFGQVLMLKY